MREMGGERAGALGVRPTYSPLCFLLHSLSALSDTGCECVGKEGPGALAQQNGSACVSGALEVSHCHDVTATQEGWPLIPMDSWQPNAAPPPPHQRQNGPDCHWAPTRGYPSLLLWNLRCSWFCKMHLMVYMPTNPSLYFHLISGSSLAQPHSFCSAISGSQGSFSSLALSFSLPPYMHFISPMNIVSAARCRKYIIRGKRQWWKKVKARTSGGCELTWALWALVCVCHCMPAFSCVRVCVCVCADQWVCPFCVCTYVWRSQQVSILSLRCLIFYV